MSKKKIEKLAYVLGCFPDDTPTFIFSEIEGLSCLGFDITIFSIHKSVTNKNHLDYKNWLPKTVYTDPLYSLPITLSHLYFMFVRPVLYFKLLFQYKVYGGKKAFWEGVYFSRIIQKMGVKHVHAHFAWKAADVARLISFLTDVPFSFTAHARDIYVRADHFRDKLEEAKFVVTCLKFNKTFIIDKYGTEFKSKIHVVYHGVDLNLFTPSTKEKQSKIDVLSIGRLVEKKGFRYLIEAISLLTKKYPDLKCIIIGEGENCYKIIEMISELGLRDNIQLHNFVTQSDLLNFYFDSKIFVLPCIVAEDGDREGIPNVLSEAMAMELPVISADLPNIAELIENGKDGILLPQKNAKAIADSIRKLLVDEKLREEMGKNARGKIKKVFDSKKMLEELAFLFYSSHEFSL